MFVAHFLRDNIEIRGVYLHTKKITAFEHVECTFSELEVPPPMSKS